MSTSLKHYVAAICAAGMLVVLACLPSAIGTPTELWMIALALLLCALADLPLLETRFGHNIEAFTFAELFLMVGLLLVPAPTLVVLAAVAILGFHLAKRIPVIKACFNAASFAIGTALAGGIATLLGAGSSGGIHMDDAAGLAVGAVAFHLWNSLAISGVMARAQET
ncbi:MAG TPA: hypothetical protein VNU26_16280, partial [Mycobacteriales bacterium]|nr:hypothetical protein [Mycobacteriales bacterium]